MPFPLFDRSRLRLKPLSQRQHDLHRDVLLPLDYIDPQPLADENIPIIAEKARRAREAGAPVILMMGAHLIRDGASLMIVDLMKKGLVTHVAMNGAGSIHDYEFALMGATTESVARYIAEGQFGLWRETGAILDAVGKGLTQGMGYGEAVGSHILEKKFPFSAESIFAAGCRFRVPVTVHIGIGYDIIHEHPQCDGAVLGEASYRDFLIFTDTVSRLEQGVFLCFGSAVMGPEVYLKALSMARNVAHQEDRTIRNFTTAVFDLQDLGDDIRQEAPRATARYYFRPYKTILVRTTAEGGESYYVRGLHRRTFPALYRHILGFESEK